MWRNKTNHQRIWIQLICVNFGGKNQIEKRRVDGDVEAIVAKQGQQRNQRVVW